VEAYPDTLNPIYLSRLVWVHGRRGFKRLWRSPGPNAGVLIRTNFLWAVAMAVTDPYKALYLSRLGLSNLAVGAFFALDMGLRIFGVLLGGLVGQRWGHKRTLLVFDTISWIIPCVMLAFATQPWQLYMATCLGASNAMVSGSVAQLLLGDTPRSRQANLYALFNTSFVLPTLLLPTLVGWGVERWGLVPVMRVLFLVAAALVGTGILIRRAKMAESDAMSRGASVGDLLREGRQVARNLWLAPGFALVAGCHFLANAIIGLNKAYYALFVTQQCGLPAGWIGSIAAAGAAAYVAASLVWVPRLRHGREQALFFGVCLAAVFPAAALGWARSGWLLMALGVAGGLVGAVQAALLSAQVAGLLPRGREGLAQSLLSSLMQAAVAAGLLLGGLLFEARLDAFPWAMAGLAALEAGLAWRLLARSRPALAGI
jgi:MFS family permease